MTRIISALLLSLLVLAGCQDNEPVRVGAPAPAISAMTPDGEPVVLASLEGKVVFVNFWWAGCGPCLAEMPAIDEAYHAIGDQDFSVLAVNFGQSPEVIRNINRRLKVSYPLLSDQLKIASTRYGVQAAPTSFLIDRKGVLQEVIYGPLTREQLEQKVQRLL